MSLRSFSYLPLNIFVDLYSGLSDALSGSQKQESRKNSKGEISTTKSELLIKKGSNDANSRDKEKETNIKV